MAAAEWIDAHTPSVSVVDSRGLAVRNIAYCRHPSSPSMEARITRNHFDATGRQVSSWDPRLWGTAPQPNLETTFDLQGRALLVESVDSGWQLSLMNQADATCCFWDGRGSQRDTEYDELLRPITVTEQMAGEPARVSDRFAYADADHEFALHNQCGQLICHDHPAGSRRLCEYGVGGLLLSERMRFLRDLDPPNWSPVFADAGLEDEVFETTQQYSPLGDMRSQTDAVENVRSFAYDRAGQLRETRLKLAGASEEPRLLVSEIRYDAMGFGVSERAGNGVITITRYAGEDGRLLQLQSCNAEGNPVQDFSYVYDPVGNITRIEDKSQLTRHFNNQRVDPLCCYVYDSLYQLIEATGSEVIQPSYGPALPPWHTTPLDPQQLRNYTQTFNYDCACNLKTRHHSGAQTFEMFTSLQSNRSVADKESLADGFDANGNQLELLRGQKMSWDIRNQLSRVTLVKRDDGPDDTECYYYDSPGHRLRKVRLTQTASRTLRAEVRYLPGVEIHRDAGTGEERHVISVEAGRSQVRTLHWVTKLPRDVRNDQLRFCLSNHLNSSTLELDEQGGVLSREVYYPFGGTALWAGASETEGKYKTIRYSGKERDATGLYYYGYRYYAPWLQRWVSADPAGCIDGLNLFNFVQNSPVKNHDLDGRVYEGADDEIERSFVRKGYSILARGLDKFPQVERDLVNESMFEANSFMISAQEMVKHYPEESKDILIAYFGEYYKSIEDRVVDAWRDIGAVLSELNSSGLGADKMVKLDFPEGDTSIAKIRTDDKYGRIFFNKNFLNDTEFLSIVIAHEVSHLGTISGISAEGPETDDYWYFPSIKQSDFERDDFVGSDDLNAARDNSRIILDGKSGNFLKEVDNALKNNMLKRVLEMVAGTEVVTSNSDAVDIFNSHQIYRSTMASENADSLVYSAFELHIKYLFLNKVG
ncbi:RHS repeat domain-containing protein [Pseudomonas sp. Root562]|uniref:RHS repeat domain-containing protein n=1 Tax=Pseudomonas sp. Root562 TaxID=1736561 RepID=UPI0009EB7036|nr:RHS repeat-associated core domain-containing protein [Pseudomonas sp. Root562]